MLDTNTKEQFFFDEKTHRYYLNDKQMMGVTTVLGVISKPQLIQWAANQAIQYVKDNVHEVIYSAEKFPIGVTVLNEILERAKTAHAQKRDKAADVGTLAHAEVEKFIKTGEWKPTKDEQINEMVQKFIDWAVTNKVMFLESEKVVHSKEHFFGGKFDFTCKIDGKTYLGDYKTGSGIYFEMFLQCAAYQLALQEQEPDTKIDGHIIVNTTKDGKFNVATHYDYETTKQGFLSALNLYKLLNTN